MGIIEDVRSKLMHKNRSRMVIRIVIGQIGIAVLAVVALLASKGRDLPEATIGELVFDGDSRELKVTRVIPTLDAPIQPGMNMIWCASFLSAWKSFESDLVKEPLSVQGSPKVALELGKASDPRPHIPEASLYVAAGWNQKGIIDQISRDLARKFPTKASPKFPGMGPNSFVMYSYLEANVKFSIPYFQNREPLWSIDLTGKVTELSSFGIRAEDDYAYFKLRQQPNILFEGGGPGRLIRDIIMLRQHPEIPNPSGSYVKYREFVVDLDHTSKPNQIILALVEPKSTLAQTVKSVEEKIASRKKQEPEGLGPNDVLLVPDIVWRISHRFAELEGREFTNAELKGQRIDVAQQDIEFRLDRSGAELKSEAKVYYAPIPTYYVFDHPFLVYMKKRGAEMPYFVMWVDNAELLGKWKSTK